ncbi:MAG: DUF3015 family protein [Proteobacteria bacterium]|nr:DUF3015 family protein [Pseudomonadota bacterium]
MRLLASIFVSILFLCNGMAKAADGSSGCGPAWYILKENTLLSSFARSLTNGFLSPVVTFGMTSGTSNCAKHNIVEEEFRSLHFATQSFDILRQDIARGAGQHLNAYLASFGCNALARQNLAGKLQEAFQDDLYLTSNPQDLVDSTRFFISASSALQSSCS